MNQPDFFSENSPFLQHPLLTPERTAQEINFVVAQLGLPSGARILDVGCGFGRHSVALAEYGYQVTGIDPSATMIAAAKSRANEAQVDVDFRQIPGQDFAPNQRYGGAICLFTTLGQISETDDNSGLVARVYEALFPDGKFIVEVPQRNATVKNLKPADHFGGKETYTAVTRQYNSKTHTITELFSLVSPAKTSQFLLRYRLYTLAELSQLLNQVGFHLIDTFADYALTPLSEDASTMIVVAAK